MALPAFSVNTWTLDGLAFNSGPDGNGFSYQIEKQAGWTGSAPARPDLTDKPTSDGSYRGSNYRGSRVIELDGIAQCARRADRDELHDTLAGLCRNADLLYPLVRNEYSRTLSVFTELSGKVDVTELPDGVTLAFSLALIATDPRKFSSEVKQDNTTIALTDLGGILWNGSGSPITGAEWNGPGSPITGLEMQSAQGGSGRVVLDNAGTDMTPVLFTITAPPTGTLPMPTITDSRSNVLTYSGTMIPGDVLTIDTGTGLCLLNGSDVRGVMTRSDFFEIPPRTTITAQFTAGGPADGAALLAQWSDAY